MMASNFVFTSTFSVYFFAKKDKQKANGNYPIFVRITIDDVTSRFNSKTDVPPNAWNAIAENAIGRCVEILQINRLLDEIRASSHTIYHDMQRRDNYVTAEKVKKRVLRAHRKSRHYLEPVSEAQ